MASDFSIIVGTVGGGVFRSEDGGQVWKQPRIVTPVPPWAPWIRVRAVTTAPYDNDIVMIGSDVGLYRSTDRGVNWDHVPSLADDPYIHCWSIAYHPSRRGTIFVGLAPGAIIRTRDDGATWERLDVPVEARCVVGSTHITDIRFDPNDDDIVWAGNEASGLVRSTDCGDTWVHLPPPGPTAQNQDVHGLVVLPNGDVFFGTPNGVWKTSDLGQSYSLHEFPIAWPPEPDAVAVGVQTYCRGVASKVGDPSVILVACGDYVPGKVGCIQRSTDGGRTWTMSRTSHTPNSTVYLFATNPANPERILAATNYGEVYISEDAGASFVKCDREFGEIRGLAWIPN